ncbi:MAG: biotin carboxylase, partial [Deltaproteobacteria bacterium]|nr:biotin carboxylase [Deltaproteobacteria bacterium]
MKRKINIAITGLQAMDNPEPGMSLSRCLKNNPNYTLSGLSYSLYCTGNFSHSFDDIFLVPYPWDSPEQWLSRIGDIHKKKPIDVLIPSLDSEIVLFSSLESQLRDMGIKMYLP